VGDHDLRVFLEHRGDRERRDILRDRVERLRALKDAWEVEPYHLETGQPCEPAASCVVAQSGPLVAEVAFEQAIGKRSSLRQTVRLAAHSHRLEFHTVVDWQEEHALLKVLFPTVVHSPVARFEIPFGVVERPTHHSTAEDLARFEVSGHRFVDVSEAGFGVAVLTDSKYGYSVYGGTIRISLLRAPRMPDFPYPETVVVPPLVFSCLLVTLSVLPSGLSLMIMFPMTFPLAFCNPSQVFAFTAFVSFQWSLWAQIFARVIWPRIGAPAKLEDARPPRFAQFVGFVFTALALTAFALSVDVAGYGLTALAFGVAALTATTGLCLGCKAYDLIHRPKPA
jgi:hypothetical protein